MVTLFTKTPRKNVSYRNKPIFILLSVTLSDSKKNKYSVSRREKWSTNKQLFKNE